ncbi:MAG: thermonuclease family protein [Alphaproteobacteria bacterium]
MKSFCQSFILFLFVCGFVFAAQFSDVRAQNDKGVRGFAGAAGEEKSYNVTVKDINLLVAGKTRIWLWGVEKIDSKAAIFNLKARTALEKLIDGEPVLCMEQARKDFVISAQCINYKEQDLSLYLLESGYVTADRSVIHGSVYEEPYLRAENKARDSNVGVWADGGESYTTAPGDKQAQNFMFGAFLLVAVFILALIVLGFFVMRGFGRVIDVQSRSLDLAMKERDLKEKEKKVIASMIYSEVKENKSKIEAYLLVYEEMLRDFADDTKSKTYQKTGEVVQKQPALGRVVFDGNTDKLDLFGGELASNLVHYYARIKTNPDYIEISPDMPLKEVQDVISAVVSSARKLDSLSASLLDKLSRYEAVSPSVSDLNTVRAG